MKTAGIITEYNPFHNGHKYHIEETKRITGADYVIAVMSGDFVQRGAPAMIDKYSRAAMALKNGVDIVIELPACYATGSAEFFALGAVSLLDKLGIVDALCFGSECGDTELIKDAARFYAAPPEAYDRFLSSYIKEGYTFPAARAKATQHCILSSDHPETYTKISELILEPNNILGLEYMKALNKIFSPIIPYTIRRQASNYHDTDLDDCKAENYTLFHSLPVTISVNNNAYAPVINSASSIRRAVQNAESIFDVSAVKRSVPDDVFEFLTENYYKTYPITEKDFSQIIKYKLLAEDRQSLTEYVDITSNLADRMKNITKYDIGITEFHKQLKAKNYTMTRLNRSLAHLLLNIKDNNFKQYIRNGYTFYARVLGIRKESSHLLRSITDNGRIPVITKVADADKQLNALGMQMLSEDIFAAHIYNQAVYEKYGTSIANEYKHGICLL